MLPGLTPLLKTRTRPIYKRGRRYAAFIAAGGVPAGSKRPRAYPKLDRLIPPLFAARAANYGKYSTFAAMDISNTPSRNFLFLLGSARREGNTEILARSAAAALAEEVPQNWLSLMDHPLPPFEDIRHSIGVYPPPQGHEKTLAEATLAATDIVFATPLYWYSVSASTKLYLDYWSGWMRVPGLDFRARMAAKTAWLISANSDEEGEKMSEALILTLKFSAEYMHMHWGGALLGYANRPGDILQDEQSLKAAMSFFNTLEAER